MFHVSSLVRALRCVRVLYELRAEKRGANANAEVEF